LGKRRALISVYDKEGVVGFAQGLLSVGFEIVSTGGTARALGEAGVRVTEVSEVTGFPEMLDGRVKTLHPRIHAGLLARQTPDHMSQIQRAGIDPIEIVAVNLYPFDQTVARGATHEETVENIDIGGPSMLRAAAKNHERVAVIVDPARYPSILEEIRERGEVSQETREILAAEAFAHTAAYDASVAAYFSSRLAGQARRLEGPALLGARFVFGGIRVQSLRYGENPHQAAAFYQDAGRPASGLASARKLGGKELSFNNLLDADTAVRTVREFEEPAAVIVKHLNPCGVGVGESVLDAYMTALEGDPVSAFGGIVAVNRRVDRAVAEQISKLFLEVVIAPGFDGDAVEVLGRRPALRILDMPEAAMAHPSGIDIKSVLGGFLAQEPDTAKLDRSKMTVPTRRTPDEDEFAQLERAWKVVRHVKSNAIVLWSGRGTVGIGAGQMNRVGAARIAIGAAGSRASGSVMASDAFFPFSDTVEAAAEAGVTAIIQPGGSVRDQESIDACNARGIAMVFTGMRHFRH
jgi:phosphoribosylaminoimidazolecarboxamide formyltransferase/IMP cyclohydrolase